MTHVREMGTQEDTAQRRLLVRIDDDERRDKVLNARNLIYERNYAVNSTHVEALLKEQSLIPTVVSLG